MVFYNTYCKKKQSRIRRDSARWTGSCHRDELAVNVSGAGSASRCCITDIIFLYVAAAIAHPVCKGGYFYAKKTKHSFKNADCHHSRNAYRPQCNNRHRM